VLARGAQPPRVMPAAAYTAKGAQHCQPALKTGRPRGWFRRFWRAFGMPARMPAL